MNGLNKWIFFNQSEPLYSFSAPYFLVYFCYNPVFANTIGNGDNETNRATFLWSLTSLGFDWALFRTINVDQGGGKTESERFQRLLAMTI